MDALENSVLDKVLSNSPLSDVNRSQLPAHNRGKAEEVISFFHFSIELLDENTVTLFFFFSFFSFFSSSLRFIKHFVL